MLKLGRFKLAVLGVAFLPFLACKVREGNTGNTSQVMSGGQSGSATKQKDIYTCKVAEGTKLDIKLVQYPDLSDSALANFTLDEESVGPRTTTMMSVFAGGEEDGFDFGVSNSSFEFTITKSGANFKGTYTKSGSQNKRSLDCTKQTEPTNAGVLDKTYTCRSMPNEAKVTVTLKQYRDVNDSSLGDLTIDREETGPRTSPHLSMFGGDEGFDYGVSKPGLQLLIVNPPNSLGGNEIRGDLTEGASKQTLICSVMNAH